MSRRVNPFSEFPELVSLRLSIQHPSDQDLAEVGKNLGPLPLTDNNNI